LKILIKLDTNYSVVKHVGKKLFGFKLSNDIEEPWDIMWTDGMVTVDMLYKMKPY